MKSEPLNPFALLVKVDGLLSLHDLASSPFNPRHTHCGMRQHFSLNCCCVQVITHEHVADPWCASLRPDAGKNPILIFRVDGLTTPREEVCGKNNRSGILRLPMRCDKWS
jgi:hypothetical protein